jgi:signal transduction histidine kinase
VDDYFDSSCFVQLLEQTLAARRFPDDLHVDLAEKLVGDLFETARARSGKMQIDVRELDLCRLVADAIESLRLEVEGQRLVLEPSLAPGVFVMADQMRLRQVIYNLLNNAIRHTPPGGRIEVKLQLDGTTALLSVSDDGIGIERDFLAMIFEPFRQNRTMAGGLGLGLSICRSLVEAHGGKITAESDGAGAGSAFRVWLPCAGPGADPGV